MEEVKNIPELRFPEFKEDWMLTKIENHFEFKNGLNKEKEYFGRGIPILNFMDVYKLNSIRLDNIKGLVDLNSSEIERYSANKGDVFFTRTSETINDIGMSATLIEEIPNCVFSGFVLRARPKTNAFDSVFTSYLFSTNAVRKEIVTKSSMTTRALTSGTLLNKVTFKFPSNKNEQTKIANFLTAVDKRIELLNRKKEQLEQYKKGVMQQIFSQQIRFKDDDGKEFPKWEEKRLGELTFKVGKKNKENIPFPVYSINNKEGFLPQSEQFDGIDSTQRGFDISMYKIIEKNTFAYNPARINVGSIGFSGELENIIISSLYVCFKTNEKLNDHFLLQYLSTYNFNKSVLRNVEGGVRDYLFYENFSNIKMPLPSKIEQQKITKFLVAIDKKIKQVSRQLDQNRHWKKGLLQKMFV